MRKIKTALIFLALLLVSFALPAQTKPSQPQPKSHPFYEQMNFLGGVFHDPKNMECGTGFIGWSQYEGEQPELIFVEDVFRKVKMNCSNQELLKGGVSCLSRGEITFSHKAGGHTYKAVLKLMNKSVTKPLLQLRRYKDGKRILLCNFRKVH